MVLHPVQLDLAAAFPSELDSIREYVLDVARSYQVPVEMVAMLALGVASGTVCGVAILHAHGDFREPPPIWALVLSEPGTRKSGVLRELLGPVVEWEQEAAQRLGPDIAAAQQSRRMDERRLKELENKASRSNKPDEIDRLREEARELAMELDANPVPTVPVLLVSESTPEALTRQLAENHGRALLADAESDGLEVVLGRYSDAKNFGVLLKGHAGDPIRERRIGRVGAQIERPAIAVAMVVQPEAVRAIWADRQAAGRGLLARFAVCLPENLLGRREVRPAPVRETCRASWSERIGRMLRVAVPAEPCEITLDSEADELFFRFQLWAERSLGAGGDLEERRAWGGKLCGLVLRVALTLHALSTWGREGAPSGSGPVSGATMTSAIAWGGFFADAERHARAALLASPEELDRQRLIECLRGRGGGCTARELAKSGPARYRGKLEEAQSALEALVASGWAAWEQPVQAGPGRPGAAVCTIRPDLAAAGPDPETLSLSALRGVFGSGSDAHPRAEASGQHWGSM